jgi:hypothetical protein
MNLVVPAQAPIVGAPQDVRDGIREAIDATLGKSGTHDDWTFDQPAPEITHGLVLDVDVQVTANDSMVFPMPDTLPVGSSFVFLDKEEYIGHTLGVSFTTSHGFYDPYNFADPGSTSTSFFKNGAPANSLNGYRFTLIRINDGSLRWLVENYGWHPSGESLIDHQYISYVSSHGHDARDEGGNWDPIRPQGWKPKRGDPFAPYLNLQDAWDNLPDGEAGYIVVEAGYDAGPLVLDGNNNVLHIVGQTGGATFGPITIDDHLLNRTLDTSFQASQRLRVKSPNVTIVSDGRTITCKNIVVNSLNGVTGEETKNSGNVTLTFRNVLGLPNISSCTVQTGNGADGEQGPSAPQGSEETGGTGLTGGSAGNIALSVHDCPRFGFFRVLGTGGDGGPGGNGDGAGGQGATGNSGNDGDLVESSPTGATEAEARAGADNIKMMTALRVLQSIEENAVQVDLSAYSTTAEANALYQALNNELTAIAALITTATGRALLTESLAQLGTGALLRAIAPTITTLINSGVLTVRQTGGTAGTDEVQISHDGTRTLFESKDGNLRFKPTGTVNSNTFDIGVIGGGVIRLFSGGANRACYDGVLSAPSSASGWEVNSSGTLSPNNSAFTLQLGSTATVPATAGAIGTAGMIRFDSNFIYMCTATNTWKRVAIATW